MLPNIVLLLLVFGATRWKKYPYLGALVLGLVKGALYFAVPLRSLPLWACILNGVIGFVVFGALGWGLVYFLRRLDRGEPQEVTYSTAGSDRVVFKWEYIPLSLIVVTLIFGEMVFAATMRSAPV
jgi:hypothetical protein